jgi:hypothetical protein
VNEPFEIRAFPSALAQTACSVVPALTEGQLHSPSDGFRVRLREEILEIPYRVYLQPERVRNSMKGSVPAGVIGACLGTRHHDGHLREECLATVLCVEEPWVVPFVVQLVGEYVLPIVERIERTIPRVRETLYAQYVSENRALFETLGRRVVSYWDAYYRTEYPKLSDYPAFRVHANLREMADCLCSTGT